VGAELGGLLGREGAEGRLIRFVVRGLRVKWFGHRRVEMEELHLYVFKYDGGDSGDYVLAKSEADARALLEEITEGCPFSEPLSERNAKVTCWPDDEPVGWVYVDEPGHPKDPRTPRELAAQYGRSYCGGWA
jgi:hypothetical protein